MRLNPYPVLYVCQCHSMQHHFVVSADADNAFIEIHLSPKSLGTRILRAIAYVFGKRSVYGDYEEVVLTPEQAFDLGEALMEWSSGESNGE